MCLANAVPARPFYGVSIAVLAGEIERLNWEATIREHEVDRLIRREKKIGHLFLRVQHILNSSALPEVKVAIIKSLCSRGPIFTPRKNVLPNPER